MAEGDVFGLTDARYRHFLAMEQQYLRTRGGAQGTANLGDTGDEYRPPIVVMLLEDLRSQQSVYGSVLTRRSYNQVQIITVYGRPSGGYFRVGLRVRGATEPTLTEPFYPLTETAAALQTLISGLPGVGLGNVEVTGGLYTVDEKRTVNIWRWLVVFTGNLAGKVMPRLESQSSLTNGTILVTTQNPLEEIGTFEVVNEVIGVPDPTPLRAGARMLCLWVPGIGYVPAACEIRDFLDGPLWEAN